MSNFLPTATRLTNRIWKGEWADGEREVAAETPVALTYDGATYAVMMATPGDLHDFAIGFSLTEGIIASPDDIAALEVQTLPAGIDVRMWLRGSAGDVLVERRRRMAGPVGCGLCGLESLEQASRQVPRVVSDLRVTPAMIMTAIRALAPTQTLNARTHAVHAAAFWRLGDGLLLTREDVGRHNALDKLAGALATAGIAAATGMVLLSSRLSVEMVQKAAMIAAPLVVAVSAPTALAIQVAEDAGITLVAVARADGFEVFSSEQTVEM